VGFPICKNKLAIFLSLEKWIVIDVDKTKDISKQVNKCLKQYIKKDNLEESKK
jgi:hypothetical protein